MPPPQLAEAEARLAEQQALYEGVRADRAMYSKNLLAAQDEIAQLRRAHAMLVRAAAARLR